VIVEQRVNATEIYVQFAGGQVYHRRVASLKNDIRRGDTKDTLASRCLDEIAALLGDRGAADQFIIDLAADGTPTGLTWCDPTFRTVLDATRAQP
jgi:hypothetical protein